MKIYSWNVNGIRSVQKKGFIDWLKAESPDIMCLQETKALPEQLDKELVEIEGYQNAWGSADRKGYSGVAVYYKLQPQAIRYSTGIEKFDREGRILILAFKDFSLLNIYFPNSGLGDERLNFKLDFYRHIIELCEGLKNEGEKLIICGDFNTAHQDIDLKNPKANRNSPGFLQVERDMLDEFLAKGFVDVFRYIYPDRAEYTWWDYRTRARERNAGWRIDCFYVTPDLLPRIRDCVHHNQVEGSDHCPIALIIE
ncbi:MAG: exodeoxyribonuclease III [Syntrophomonadaceae bacterium]|nr:exodeoxyribonuclease III [Syntrophomonadaceae bacterium]